ncbi:hypothetical protein HWV62_37512 [Athelia sp. TMB]|nr:hypothetical protein HWV62_37512 [Athelia sp. TMB]
MSAFNHYRNNGGWGTKQFQFPAPPNPNYQPQPGWHGQDYFRAHAGTPDLSLYNNAWNRVRDYHDIDGTGFGVGLNEARHWHSRAYGGLGNPNQMSGAELGHAAAYEAYRTWMHSSYLYEPLSGDIERQREGLIGLAIAEDRLATRLLQYAGRGGYDRVEACDSAAATASQIFYQSRRNIGMNGAESYHGRSRSNSFSGYGASAGGYGGSSYGGVSPSFGRPPSPYNGGMGGVPAYSGSSRVDPYAADNTFMYPSHHRSRSRSHSRSGHGHRHRSHSPAVIMAAPSISPGGYATSPMAIPGTIVQPSYSSNGSYGGAYGAGGMGVSPYAGNMPVYGGAGYAPSGPQVLPPGTMRPAAAPALDERLGAPPSPPPPEEHRWVSPGGVSSRRGGACGAIEAIDLNAHYLRDLFLLIQSNERNLKARMGWRQAQFKTHHVSEQNPLCPTAMSSKTKPLPLSETLRDLALLRASDVDLTALLPKSSSPAPSATQDNDIESSVGASYDFASEARQAIRILNRGDIDTQGGKVEQVRSGLEDLLQGFEPQPKS